MKLRKARFVIELKLWDPTDAKQIKSYWAPRWKEDIEGALSQSGFTVVVKYAPKAVK